MALLTRSLQTQSLVAHELSAQSEGGSEDSKAGVALVVLLWIFDSRMYVRNNNTQGKQLWWNSLQGLKSLRDRVG